MKIQFRLWFTAVLLITGMLAMITVPYCRLRPARRLVPAPALYCALVAAVGVLGLGVTAGILRLKAEQHLNRAYTYREKGRWEKVIEEYLDVL